MEHGVIIEVRRQAWQKVYFFPRVGCLSKRIARKFISVYAGERVSVVECFHFIAKHCIKRSVMENGKKWRKKKDKRPPRKNT